MQRIFLIVLLLSGFISGGCASKAEIQLGMDAINNTWRNTNFKYLQKYGVRVYKMDIQAAKQSSLAAMKDLGFQLNNDNTDQSTKVAYLGFKGIAPAPLSKEEFKKVKEVEEPMMQAIAATEVGSFTSNMFYLSNSKDFEIIVNIKMIENLPKTNIYLDFNMYYRKPNPFIMYGDQPPPEAVKMSIKKFWNAFDKNANSITGLSIDQLKG
jgi:hypothetical protein